MERAELTRVDVGEKAKLARWKRNSIPCATPMSAFDPTFLLDGLTTPDPAVVAAYELHLQCSA